jgi:RNA polymerase sigma factor (sigma-70 family)
MAWPKPFQKSTGRSDGSGAGAEFERLMREHIPAFYRQAFRWTGTVDRAEDLVQELLMRLFPLLAELRTLDRVRPWAMRVMYRIFVDQLRRERKSPVQFGGERRSDGLGEEDEDDQDVIDPSQEPPQLVEQQLTQERIAIAWKQLGHEHRVVLSMHDIEGYSLVEIASVMDIPVGTLKSRIHRARAKLRTALGERFVLSDRV